MANALYSSFKRAVMSKQIDLTADSITAVLVKSSYTFSQAHTNFTTNISANAVAGASVVLASQAVLNVSNSAEFNAANPTFAAVTAGSTVGSIVLYHTTSGTPIAYIDTGSGLPIITSGADISIGWSAGGDKIFSL